MDILVRRLKAQELDTALELVWKTYLEFEAPEYGPKGVETFRKDVMDNDDFKSECKNGNNPMWGAFDDKKLVGVFVMRGESHISLVFTSKEYHRKGVATKIFEQLVLDVKKHNNNLKELTVNSSPYGRAFYHNVGFVDVDKEKTINGIRFTPMKYTL